MVVGANTFVISMLAGVVIGGITAYFRYLEADGTAALRTLLGWLLAFAVTGLIATPIARWLLVHVF